MNKGKGSNRKILLFFFGFIVLVIISVELSIQLFYPRMDRSFEEIDEIYVLNFADGKYEKAGASEEDMKRIFEILNHSRVTVDFLSGDGNEFDGPGIIISYTDGTSDSWSCADTDHTCFSRYYYLNKWGMTSVSISSKRLLNIIESYKTQ